MKAVLGLLIGLFASLAIAATTTPVPIPHSEDAEYEAFDELQKTIIGREHRYREGERTNTFIGGNLVLEQMQTADGLVLSFSLPQAAVVTTRIFSKPVFYMLDNEYAEARIQIVSKLDLSVVEGSTVRATIKRGMKDFTVTYRTEYAGGVRIVESVSTYNVGSRLPISTMQKEVVGGRIMNWITKTKIRQPQPQ